MHQQSDELDELLKSLFSNQLKDLAENINTKLNENSNKTKEQTDKISTSLKNLISEKFDEHSIEDTIQDLKETFDEQIQLLQNNLNQETLSLKNKFPNESYDTHLLQQALESEFTNQITTINNQISDTSNLTQQEIKTLATNYSHVLQVLERHTDHINKIATTQQQQQQILGEINEFQHQQTDTLQHALNAHFQELKKTISNDTHQVKTKLKKQNIFIIFIIISMLISISLNLYFWNYAHL